MKHLLENNLKNLPLSFYAALFAAAFALNWIWEVAQTFAFEVSGISIGKMLLFCAFASVIDGIVTVLIFWLLQRFLKSFDWKFYLAAAGSGALCAVFFEQIAFTIYLWSYDEGMPVLPFLGTGLLPFLQLTILVPTAIRLTLILKRN